MNEQEDFRAEFRETLRGGDGDVDLVAHARRLDDDAQDAGFDEFAAEGDDHGEMKAEAVRELSPNLNDEALEITALREVQQHRVVSRLGGALEDDSLAAGI